MKTDNKEKRNYSLFSCKKKLEKCSRGKSDRGTMEKEVKVDK